MSKRFKDKLGSTIYQRVQSLRISEVERNRALNALYDADLLVDGIVWVVKKIEQFGGRLFLKPALKH